MDSARIPQRNLGLLLLIMLQACAHTPATPQTAEVSQNPLPPSEVEVARQQITKLQDRVQDLETRLSALNDKINLENGAPAKLPTAVVEAPAAHGKVIPDKRSAHKPETAEVAGADTPASSEAIDRFREAKILYDSKRYSDSVLEFSEFVKREPDHPLAPAAQYYVGMSYLKQKEYKLAEEELSRGLLSYGHSNYVPDTLLALSDVSIPLQKIVKVAYYREKLLANFPNSPQAKGVKALAPPPPAEMAAPAGSVHAMETSDEPTVVSKPELPSVTVPSAKGGEE